MDIIQQCLSLAPVPYLAGAFGLLKSISDNIQRVKSNMHQLRELAVSIARLLSTLNDQYQRNEKLEAYTADALGSLESLLRDILNMIQKYQSYGVFKMFFIKEDIQLVISSYDQRIVGAFRNFQITATLDIQALHKRSADARVENHEQSLMYLRKLESNQNLIMAELHVNQMDPKATMTALKKRIDHKTGDSTERQIVQRSLSSIENVTKSKMPKIESWTFTPLELVMGDVISEGGFGTVYNAKWRGAEVAVKKLKNREGVTAHAKDLTREIETWSKLRHPNILQFFGANTLVNDPFIVMPLMKRGNVRDYLLDKPQCDHVVIIRQISFGLEYLHSNKIIHGDLKAANILIDDGEKAVLCDFGLSQIKEDIDSRSVNKDNSSAQGSLYWMAPERFYGSSLRKPCDIYSFAMTMYEVYTNTFPLASVRPTDFREVVADKNRRPERPSDDEAPQLTDDGWQLMQSCWAPEPQNRPQIDSVVRSLHEMAASGGHVKKQPNSGSEATPLIESRRHGSVLGETLCSEPESMTKAEETPDILPSPPIAPVYNNTRSRYYRPQQRPPFESAQQPGLRQYSNHTPPPQYPPPQPYNAYTVPDPYNMYGNGNTDHMRPYHLYPQQVQNYDLGGSVYNSNKKAATYPKNGQIFVGGFHFENTL